MSGDIEDELKNHESSRQTRDEKVGARWIWYAEEYLQIKNCED